MKRCSTCNRTYTDPNLSFCVDDGTPLTAVAEDDATVVTPRNTEANDRNTVAYQPPRDYVPPGGEVKRRRMWPWLVGLAGAFIFGILVIAIAATVIAPRIVRRLEQESRTTRDRSNTRPLENANTTQPAEPAENVNAPVPTDHNQVLAQLTQIENEWTVANLNADRKKLDRILADDFVGGANDGELQSKTDYIREIERDTQVDKWEFSDLKLVLAGDRATLSGTITYQLSSESRAFDFVDKFVWREGRWQATNAEIKEKRSPEFNL
jgi:hypothetical protein